MLGCVVSIWDDIIILCSMEKILKIIKSRHSLKQRWKPGHEGFDSAVKLVGKERRISDTLRALHALSIERHFLLTLKKKYADQVILYFSSCLQAGLFTYYYTSKPPPMHMVLTSPPIC